MLRQVDATVIKGSIDLLKKFHEHRQFTALLAVSYAFLCTNFLMLARLVFSVSTSVLVGDAIGLAAVALSGLALIRTRAPSRPIVTRPRPVSEEPFSDDCPPSQAGSPAPLLSLEASRAATGKVRRVPPRRKPPFEASFCASPVVTLPHRKIALVAGSVSEPNGGAEPAEDLDALRVAHAIAFAATQAGELRRPIMVTLSRAGFGAQIIDEFLELAPECVDRIVFELDFEMLGTFEGRELASVRRYHRLGVQFAARKASAFKLTEFITHQELWRCLSYIMMPAAVILETPLEVIELVEPLGSKLIALDVSTHEQLVEILDYRVSLASGPLFTSSHAPPSLAKGIKARPSRRTAVKAKTASGQRRAEVSRSRRPSSAGKGRA